MKSLSIWENIVLAEKYFFENRRIYNFLLQNPKKIKEFQLESIKKLVNLAYTQTTFYNQLYKKHNIFPQDIKTWEDFYKLPTITKEDIMQNSNEFIVSSRKHDKNLFLSKSSGSSGKIIDIYFEGDSWIRQAQVMLRMFKREFNLKPFDKLAFIYTSEYPYHSVLGMYKVNYIYTLTPADDMINKLLKIRPDFITSYTSILLDLINKYPKEIKKLKLKAISTNSEQSTLAQRNYISSVFNCPVFDEYSTEELTLVAFECKYHNYHLQEDTSFIEILNPNSNEKVEEGALGEIVGTCLVNNVMPFIRYRQGDLAKIKSADCTCTNKGRILYDLSGRKIAAFKLKDGSQIPSGKLLDWTYELLLKNKLPINQFQLIQTSFNRAELHIVPSENYASQIHDAIIQKSFQKEYKGNLLLSIIKEKSISRGSGGKFHTILSKVQ